MSRSAIVLGAGMVGVCCALSLQKRGFAVTLIDRREPGSETSYGNAGVISRASILPLNNPSLWTSLPAYLRNDHPAIRYRLSHLLRNPGWILRFLAEARPSRLPHRIRALDSLTSQALPLHKALMDQAGVRHRLRETGSLKLWRNEAGPDKAQAEKLWFEDHGVRCEVFDRQGLSALEPDLNPIFSAGLLQMDSGSVDWPQAIVQAYAALCVARGGKVVTAAIKGLTKSADGWSVKTDGGEHRADIAVVALGPWSTTAPRPAESSRARSSMSRRPICWPRWRRVSA